MFFTWFFSDVFMFEQTGLRLVDRFHMFCFCASSARDVQVVLMHGVAIGQNAIVRVTPSVYDIYEEEDVFGPSANRLLRFRPYRFPRRFAAHFFHAEDGSRQRGRIPQGVFAARWIDPWQLSMHPCNERSFFPRAFMRVRSFPNVLFLGRVTVVILHAVLPIR